MQRIIVSSVGRVPALVEHFKPDGLLSIAAVPKELIYPPPRHLVLHFADIDQPNPMTIGFAATREHIDAIESLRDAQTLLINCQRGQRRSPTAALILLAALFPGQEASLAAWIRTKPLTLNSTPGCSPWPPLVIFVQSSRRLAHARPRHQAAFSSWIFTPGSELLD